MARVKLGALCAKIGSGATPRGGKEVYTEAGVAFIRSQNVYNDRFDGDGIAFITANAARSLDGVSVEPNDVLLNITGESVGRCCLAPVDLGPARVSQHVMIVRPEPTRLNSRYLRYWLISAPIQGLLAGMSAAGATRRALTKGMVEGLDTSFPPIDEQRRIAAILGALDDKIELNRKMNRTLEEMAQALFQSWFIDFDGHEDLVDSEIGPVPRGWAIVPLAQTGRWISGGTPTKSNDAYWGGSIPWFSAKSLGSLWLTDSDDRLTEAGADAGTRRVPRRSVLFIVRGMSLATEWRIGMTTRDATLNQDLKAIVDDGTVVPELVLLWLLANREIIRAKADEAGHGTKRLPTEVLHAHAMAVPPRAEQERVAGPLVNLLARIERNLAECTTLASLRDTLLPKLISGELRVPEAEAALPEAH
jgi:type I restriction enzyme S subunit